MDSRGRFPQPGLSEMECGVCWQTMNTEGAPMHEALITRGHVHKADKEIRNLIYHPCNVVLRHTHCPPVEIDGYGVTNFSHGGGTGGQLQFERCAMALIGYEGYDRVNAYLEAMAQLFPQVGHESWFRFQELVERTRRYG